MKAGGERSTLSELTVMLEIVKGCLSDHPVSPVESAANVIMLLLFSILSITFKVKFV